jgi:hypothetical protein
MNSQPEIIIIIIAPETRMMRLAPFFRLPRTYTQHTDYTSNPYYRWSVAQRAHIWSCFYLRRERGNAANLCVLSYILRSSTTTLDCLSFSGDCLNQTRMGLLGEGLQANNSIGVRALGCGFDAESTNAFMNFMTMNNVRKSILHFSLSSRSCWTSGFALGTMAASISMSPEQSFQYWFCSGSFRVRNWQFWRFLRQFGPP